MIKPKIKSPDFRKIRVELDKVADDVIDEIGLEVLDTAEFVAEKAKLKAPINESRLYNEIKAVSLGKLDAEVVANTKYAAFMEFGTKGKAQIPAGTEAIAAEVRAAYSRAKGEGKTGNIAEMERSIRRWVRLKGIVGTFDIKTKRRKGRNKAEAAREDSAVFLIMRSILKFGVSPQPFFYPSVQEGTKELGKRLARIVNKKR